MFNSNEKATLEWEEEHDKKEGNRKLQSSALLHLHLYCRKKSSSKKSNSRKPLEGFFPARPSVLLNSWLPGEAYVQGKEGCNNVNCIRVQFAVCILYYKNLFTIEDVFPFKEKEVLRVIVDVNRFYVYSHAQCCFCHHHDKTLWICVTILLVFLVSLHPFLNSQVGRRCLDHHYHRRFCQIESIRKKRKDDEDFLQTLFSTGNGSKFSFHSIVLSKEERPKIFDRQSYWTVIFHLERLSSSSKTPLMSHMTIFSFPSFPSFLLL